MEVNIEKFLELMWPVYVKLTCILTDTIIKLPSNIIKSCAIDDDRRDTNNLALPTK